MPFLTGRRRHFFLALAARIVPENAAQDEGACVCGFSLVAERLADLRSTADAERRR